MGEELRELLGQLDDDYLIGLGNKGILKRAYKDLEQESPVADWQQDQVQVKLKEETCAIRVPLGESSCTCPSRSMCRHIVTAILWLKGQQGQQAPEESGEPSEESQEVSGEPPEDSPKFAEFLELPLERLVKACGVSHFRKLLAHVRAEQLPPVEVSSIVTVELPWEQAAVKLLEPLDYSTCSCHSRELCTHKAQALLIWRLREGACTLQDLEGGQEEKELDLDQMRSTCQSVRESVKMQLCTGLSRQSPEISESMERLAVISHRAGLADMERSLRETAAEYAQYFDRQASFREEELLGRLLELYRLAGDIQGEEDSRLVRELAGSFKDTYELEGRLRLVGMGSRSFKSMAGYEGEIYYFLDTRNGRFLTWTDARPTFYEGSGRKPPRALENSQAPWGLNCSREQLLGMEIELADAKLASGGRLSSSQETKGELLGAKDICAEEVSRRIVWDYRRLLEGGVEKQALLGAVRWGEASFDKVQQRFFWELFDIEGRRLYVSLRYTKEEKLTIRLLERLVKRLKEGEHASLVFFGSLYLAEGRLCLYPVEFWLQEDDGLLESCLRTAPGRPEAKEGAEAPEDQPKPSKEILDIMEQYLKEARRHLADLFVSGIDSSSEELAGRILSCAEEGEELGLHSAGRHLTRLGELLNVRRHQMEFLPEPVMEVWETLECYLKACEEKVSMDRVRLSMEGNAELE